jgi:ABC-type glycerol-3-phosphate transport system substrate-binding protein
MKKWKRVSIVILVLAVFCSTQVLWAGGGQEGQAKGKISFLTWNIPMWEPAIMGAIDDFHVQMPNVEVEWLDKKGSEWATFYQTQIASGTVPDVAQIQGVLWVQYADQGLLLDLKPYLDKEPNVVQRFDKNMFNSDYYLYNGKRYNLPFFSTATVLYTNKNMMKAAGLGSAPATLEDLVSAARKMTNRDQGKYGFMTLNFDWLYWTLFQANGVSVLNSDRTKAAFNTPGAVQTINTLKALTDEAVIPKLSWTARWAEPNELYASGNVGFFNSHGLHGFAPNAAWANANTLGVESFPGRWSVPNYHGLVVSSQSKNPDAAWAFSKVLTNDKWQEDLVRTMGILCGNVNVYKTLIADAQFKKDNPLKVANYTVQLQNTDKLCGPPLIPEDEEVKQAFYSQFQRAVFGEISANEALANAEKAVNGILSD